MNEEERIEGNENNYTNKNNTILNEDEIQSRFKYFGMISLLYACFVTFCIYENPAGITVLFFVAGTLYYFYICMKQFGIVRKRDSYFYEIGVLLLGMSTWITDDPRIIAFNYLGVILLLLSFMIHQVFQDQNWTIPQYLVAFGSVLLGIIRFLPDPFKHFHIRIHSQEADKKLKVGYILLGIAIAFPILVIILGLLSSADYVFAQALNSIFNNVFIPDNVVGIFFMILFVFFFSYCFITYLVKKQVNDIKGMKNEGEPIIAITVNCMITLVYVLFCGIQVFYLFMGNLTIPNNYTYAQYAREGFFQLLAVCIINLLLVNFCIHYFRRNRILNILLMVISLCTYIMIASSAFRMILYIQQYDLTFLRVFTLWALVVISFMITGVIFYIRNSKFSLFRYSLLTISILYIMLSFSHPDYFIAKYNSSQLDNTGVNKIDTGYLSELSVDAAPAILEYLSSPNITVKDWNAYQSYFEKVKNKGDHLNIRTFNVSIFIGKNATEDFFDRYVN